MKSKKVDISTLVLNEANPRFIKDGKFRRLMRKIKERPWYILLRPIIVNDENTILAGNMRMRACEALGWEKVPVFNIADLSKEDKEWMLNDEDEAYIVIEDNNHEGEWDLEILHSWDTEFVKDLGIDITWPEPLEDEDVKEEKEPAESYVCEHCGSTVKV